MEQPEKLKKTYDGAPIHPLAAILTIVLDYLWTPVEGGTALTGLGIIALPFLILAIAIVAFIGVFLLQKFTANDDIGSSIAKAFVMAVIAAIPLPIASTIAGGSLIAWAGLGAASGLLSEERASKNK